ncbi:Spy/CpxP family protein refolding chaperone [Xylophilus sp. GOD-11R]|uniref:Spy/CpxP family protein refolding chaperone n=1 Tax=Xylophilus sp. GOD-11R TaxID=3089814 RepID=UPI00298BE651|nr:Spy/CpxP family protein refolding chaperone [Xylophilus sp. GOD-11R]WPB57026.1 Spy/CpxP family protein refolding chaperone [Xylophilus sp. GOD-11R]
MRPHFRTIVLTSLLASAGIGSVFAQTAPAPAPQTAPQAGPHGEHRGPGGRFDPAQREARAQKQLAVLKAKLRITPQQEGAWTTFTTAMRPAPEAGRPGQGPKFDREELAKLTTPQRVDRMRELRARHMAEADAKGDAVKTFYAALNPAQQQTFDALPPPHFGGPGFGPDDRQGHGPRGGRPGPMGGEAPAR